MIKTLVIAGVVFGFFAPLLSQTISPNVAFAQEEDRESNSEEAEGKQKNEDADGDPDTNTGGTTQSGTVNKVTNVQQGNQQQGAQPQKINLNYLDCSWWNIGCHIFNGLAHLSFIIGNVLAAMSGIFLDIFLMYSISSYAYKDAGFILEGWEILRDFTNIAFIFALLNVRFKLKR